MVSAVIVDCPIPVVSYVASSCCIMTSMVRNNDLKLADIGECCCEYNDAAMWPLRLGSFPTID